jgi:hypothetical protein
MKLDEKEHRELSRPVWACPRNLTGSNGFEKRQKTNMQKAGIRCAGCSGGDTQQPRPPPSSLLYKAANKEVEQWFSGRSDLIVIWNKGNLRSLLSAHTGTVPDWRAWYKHPCSYEKQLCCILLSFPSAPGGCANPSLQIIWHGCAHVKFSYSALHREQWSQTR